MQTDAQKLTAVEAALRRWHTRLTRATNAIRKLETKRRRLAKPQLEAVFKTLADRPREHTKVRLSSGEVVGVKTDSEIPLPELDALFIPAAFKREVHTDGGIKVTVTKPDDLAAMPSNQKKAGDPGPKLLADLLNPASKMNRLRMERAKAKREGLPKPIDKTAMPLSGNDALKRIKAARKK